MFIFISLAAAVGIIIGCADAYFLQINKKKLPLVILRDGVGCNIAALLLCKVFSKAIKGLPVASNSGKFPFIYAGVLLLCGILWILATGIFDGQLSFTRKTEDTKKHLIIRILSVVFVFLGTAAFTGTRWGKSTFGDVAADQMIINLMSPTDGTSDEVMSTLWSGPVFQTVAVTVVFALFAFSGRSLIYHKKRKDICLFPLKARRIICFILSLAVLGSGVAYLTVKFDLTTVFKLYVMKSSFIEDNYADPREVKMEFPEKKRNLIFIYLESMENSYLSKDMGGYLDENLLAPLTELSEEGYTFSNTDNRFGGPVATIGCTWSVASMVNMNTGLPMRVSTGKNNYGEPGKFLPGAVALGDILKAEGYEQSLMFGATATFGGLRYFYNTHGDYTILDYDAAKEKGWISKDYKEWWGYEDDKLYEYAKTELTRLYETGKPFDFIMETADTHFPNGYVGKNTPTPRKSQYANVIAYSASEVTKFVRWIQEQPFYENTTVILIGDHLSMDTRFFANFDESYLRTTFNVILNPAPSVGDIPEERLRNRWWANFDMFPTTMAAIGVKIDGDKLGLGTNLFSGKQTLFEENGGEEGWISANEKLEFGSPFYKKNILNAEYKPFDAKNIAEYINEPVSAEPETA